MGKILLISLVRKHIYNFDKCTDKIFRQKKKQASLQICLANLIGVNASCWMFFL